MYNKIKGQYCCCLAQLNYVFNGITNISVLDQLFFLFCPHLYSVFSPMTSSSNSLYATELGQDFSRQQHIYDLPTNFAPKKASTSIDEHSLTNGGNFENNRSYCRALYDFRSEFPNELEFSTGDIIFIEKRKNREWLEGECQSNGRKGIFPQNFVDIVVPLQDEEEVSVDLSVPFSSVTIADDLQYQIGVASALYDFDPRFPDELRLRAGESVQVLALVGTDWVKCRETTSGSVGIVPQCFLHIFFDTSTDETKVSSEGGNEQSNVTRPWDVPRFQPSNFSNCSSVYDSVQSVGSLGSSISQRPPPRPPPPSLMRQKEAKVTSSKRHSLQQPHQFNVELVDKADKNLATFLGQEIQGVQLDSHLLVQNTTTSSAVSKPDSKQKVVLDLLNTERTYLFDLNTWETSIHESAELSAEDKKTLTNGYLPLKQLSQTLISAIMVQKDFSADDQNFGNIFMELKDRFFAAYAYHFRYVEQISIIVENGEDESLQKALHKCLLVMRRKGSNVFDVPTAVSRPIQRCLKYPLYVGELLKNTPIHHSDHPKLMESLRQFGTLASRMNECKRRKELIRKYRSQEQLSLADRLSRINMHSLVKKSNRLKYRINRSIGLSTARYTEFDYLVQLLEEAERRLCKFLYCAQLYKKHIEQSVKRHEDSYKGVCHVQDENVVKAFAVMFRRLDELCRRHLQTFDQEVITEGKKLVRSDLAKLVHKRFDKLADYETAKATHKNSDELEMRRAEFEALSNQIKTQLPRVIGTINTRVLELIKRVNEIDAEFLGRMDKWFTSERPEKVRDCFSSALPFRAHLSASHRHTLAELNKIAVHLSSESNVLQKRKSLRLSFRGPKTNHRSNELETQKRRAQTLKERDALTKICHAQQQTHQLRRVQYDWESASMVLKKGDAVVVKAHRQDGFSLCDNAVSAGLVPVSLLCPFDNSFTAPFSPESSTIENQFHPIDLAAESAKKQQKSPDVPLLLLDFITPKEDSSNCQKVNQTNSNLLAQIAPNSQSVKRDLDVDLIDLEDNLIDLDSPPKINVQPRELKPISTDLGERTEPFLSEYYGKEKPRKIERLSSPSPPFPPIPDRPISSSSCQPSLPTPILSDYTLFSEPIRIAPPPPLTNRRHDDDDISPQLQADTEPIEKQHPQLSNLLVQPKVKYGICQPDNSSHFSSSSFAVCVFDFSPSLGKEHHLENNQLTIMEGEMVEIIRRYDDAGNNEWCLVRKLGQHQHDTDQLNQGYVPANYLSILKNPMNTRV